MTKAELREAVKDYNENNGGYYSPWYAKLMYDKSDGELWTDVFYSLGHNEWKSYRSSTIVNIGDAMEALNIRITTENVRQFVKNIDKYIEKYPWLRI